MKYVAGLALGGAGGALAIVEKRPRRVGFGPPEWNGFGMERAEKWADDHAVTFLDRLPQRESVPKTIAKVKAMLGKDPLTGDVMLIVDATHFGLGLQESFYDSSLPRLLVQVSGDVESGDWSSGSFSIPLRDLHAALTLDAQGGQLKIADGLSLGPPLCRAIENLDGPADADLARATALCIWWARKTPSSNGRASAKPPVYGSKEWAEQREEERQEERRREWRRAVREGEGWSR